MDEIIKQAMQLDIGNLLVMGAMMWFFYMRLDRKFEKRFDEIDQRILDLRHDIQGVDRRLARLEGAFSAKECCALRETRRERAE